MLRSVFGKGLFDQRRALLGYCIGLLLFAAYLIGLYPSIRDNPALGSAIEKMPEPMRAMLNIQEILSPEGFLQAELLSIMLPFLLALFATTTGVAAIAGEEERRTLDLVLAHPVSRRRYFLERTAGLLVGTALVALVLFLALVACGPWGGIDVAPFRLAAALVGVTQLAWVFGALGLGLGGAGLSRPAALAVTGSFGVATYLVDGLSRMTAALDVARYASPFYYALSHDPLRAGLHAGHAAVLVGMTLVPLGVGLVRFERRDIGV